jgi:glycosyltransferase involved in cell wall biosynthesis
MKRLLFIGDGVTRTGFSTVLHNIIKNLPTDIYEVHHLAVNYRGDPHDFSWKIYPAHLGGDLYGFGRLPQFATAKFDGIFILNDPWGLDRYLKVIKQHFKEVPPIIVYFPVDGTTLAKDWFGDFKDLVKEVVTYTMFGAKEVLKVYQPDRISIIPHGVDKDTFYKIDREEARKSLFGEKNYDDFKDSFIVLNAN